MSTRLLLAPAAGGKTRYAIDHIRQVLADEPLTPVRVIVPDRNQQAALQRRLAEHGAVGVRVSTFSDLYRDLLAQATEPFPVAPEPVIHRLLRAAIDRIADRDGLVHYGPIRRRPGLVSVLASLFAELKRSRIIPQDFVKVLRGRGARLEELAAIYEEYHSSLVRLNWSDHEGLGWLAVDILAAYHTLAEDWRLVVIDGFDSFNPTQIALLKALTSRVKETLITLTGDRAMSRLAYRRFARTLERISEHLGPEIVELPRRANAFPPLAHLEAEMFRPDAPSMNAGSNITFIEAQNTSWEAREALRWIKTRIVRDAIKPNECAIVARDISLYRIPLREAAREFGIPLRLACGEPLASNPAVASLLTLLELPLQDWARRPLLDVLRTPYFDLSAFGLSRDDARLLDEVARAGQVVGGIEQWREALELAASRGDAADEDHRDEESSAPRAIGEIALALWERLNALHQRLSPPQSGSLTDYVRWLEELISAQNGVRLADCLASQSDTVQRDKAAIQVFAESLRALVLGETVAKERTDLNYSEFYAELRALLDSAVYQLDEATDPALGQVYATSLAAARGVCYRAAALIGLSEGLFPAPLHEDPLLSDEEREMCAKAGLALEPAMRSDQQTLFYEGVTRATEYLLLSRPYLSDDGESWEPSPYWSAALALFEAPVLRVRPEDVRSHPDAASRVELLAWCVRRRSLPGRYGDLGGEWETLRQCGAALRSRLGANRGGDYEGEAAALSSALSRRFGSEHVWSASRLEAYASCPFHFFTSVALGLEERKTPEPGYDAAQLGSMLHEILEMTYRQAPDPTSLDDLLAALARVAESAFAAAPARYGFRPSVLWETQQRELMDLLSRTLAGLVERNGQFRPAHFERGFGLNNNAPLVIETAEGPVRFRGIIDRVDLDENGGVRVIDYKTGASGLRSSDLIEGKRLQLAIYSLAATDCLKLGKPADGFYWAIRSGEISQLQLSTFACDTDDGQRHIGPAGAIELAVKHITSYLREIRQGTFTPSAPSGGCKGYCPARLFCWRYEPASW